MISLFFFSRMLQMLSGPTLYRISVPVSSTIVGTGGTIDVDTHVRLAGGQDLRPYVDTVFMERFSSDLASLDRSVYQEFADSLIQVSVKFMMPSSYYTQGFFLFNFQSYFERICSPHVIDLKTQII